MLTLHFSYKINELTFNFNLRYFCFSVNSFNLVKKMLENCQGINF